jgi:ankyrin repeat protein
MRWSNGICVGVLALMLMAGISYAGEIQDAVKNGRIDDVRRLITADSSLINAADDAGDTPLHLACRGGQFDIAGLLIDAGADLNATNKQSMTPLRSAIQALNIDITELLLDRGAKADDVHPMFGSVISQAFSTTCQRNGDPRLVETLMAHGTSFDAGKVDPLGMSPLDWAAHFGNVPMARIAVEHGADVNLVSPRLGRPPLLVAVTKGNSELVTLLLDHGADISIPDKTGNSPLFYAVDKGRTAMVNKLLAHGASIDFTDSHYGRGLLHLAAIKGFRDVAELLVAHGAKVEAADSSGKTPLFFADQYGNRDVAEYLTGRGENTSKTAAAGGGIPLASAAKIDQGDALIWYLNHRGWAVQTSDRMLVFDAEEFEVRRSDNPSLANGFITAKELKGHDVTALFSCYHGNPGEPAYIHTLADSLDDIAFVHLVDDAWRGSPNTTYVKGGADTAVAGIKVQTIDIASGMPMLAHMCNTGDLTIYYQAFAAEDPAAMRQNYEFLSRYADTVDIAFLPMPESEQVEPDAKLFLERFPTRSIVLVDADRREYLFPDAARRIAEWGFPTKVLCAENPGDHFRYQPSAK